jgi:hypothetical protein
VSATADPLSEARREAVVAREVLEGLLLSLPELPRAIDPAPIAASVEQLMTGLALWVETDLHHPLIHVRLAALRDGVAGTSALFAAIEGSPSALRGLRSLEGIAGAITRATEQTVDAIVAAQDQMRRGPRPVEVPRERPFRASEGTPSLQLLARPGIAPVLAVQPSNDRDDEDAVDHRPREPARDRSDPGELKQIQRLARDAMQDLGIFESLRHRNADEPWTSVAGFEQRLLDNVDALLSLEVVEPGAERTPGALAQLVREATDTSFPDPGRAFAATFALGCVQGEDVVDVLLLALRQADALTLAAHATALALAPSPAIEIGIRRLLRQSEPRLLALALAVLRERRGATFADAAVLLNHPRVEVAAAAARALGVAPEHRAAIDALEALFTEDPEDDVAAAIAESLLLLDAPMGLAIVRERLAESLVDPATSTSTSTRSEELPRFRRLQALAGTAVDAATAIAAFACAPEYPAPLGWLGHVDAVPTLVAALIDEMARNGTWLTRTERESALIEALFRITGAPMLTPPRLGAPAGRFEEEAFAAWWRDEAERFPPHARYRFGQPYTLAQSLAELEAEASSIEAREHAAFELGLVLGPTALLRIEDWVARQASEIEALRARVARVEAVHARGEFLGQRLGGRPRAGESPPQRLR